MSSRTLLCVDPDPAAVARIRGAVQPYDFVVTQIEKGNEALAWAHVNRPDLVVLSVEPRKIGYALCNKIKRDAELSDTPVILTSGTESPETFEKHKRFKTSADGYLLKPFEEGEFLTLVDDLLNIRGGGQNLQAQDVADVSSAEIVLNEEPESAIPFETSGRPLLDDSALQNDGGAQTAATQAQAAVEPPAPRNLRNSPSTSLRT